MAGSLEITCHACGHVGFDDGDDGFFYCLRCGSQAEDIVDTAVAEDDIAGDIYIASHRRQNPSSVPIKSEPFSQSQQPQSQFWDSLKSPDDVIRASGRVKIEDDRVGDGIGPTGPSDFGSNARSSIGYDDFHREVRLRYVMGLQLMIEMQSKALVDKFDVSPLVCGFAVPILMQYVTVTRLLADDWADQAINESESQKQGQPDDFKPRAQYSAEPHNIHGQRAVMIWFRSLSKTLPLSYTLAITFLACHIAREAVLPTDILKWSLEGKIPYFAAFLEIEKEMGPPSSACPLSSSFMFKPKETVPLHKLESQAASIAQITGLELPPVNFCGIALRYLTKLSLPVGDIIPSVCQIYEWSFPPELWLSENELRLPTRVCVMSMIIVAIRILYNIHGFGFWEMNLSGSSRSPIGNGKKDSTCNADVRDDARHGFPSLGLENSTQESSKNSSHEKSELDATELLCNLESRYDELQETYEYSKDLPTYLQYCKDVVFAGLEPSFGDYEEEKIIKELWDFYQDQKDSGPSADQDVGCNGGSHQKRSRDRVMSSEKQNKKTRDNRSTSSSSMDVGTSHADDYCQQNMSFDDCSPSESDSLPGGHTSTETHKDRAIKRMKADMEENRFCYIPPRVNVKRLDYLHYVRKKDEGAYTYAAHADYYILLRSCARVAQVDIRIMHVGVMSFERRLAWLEKRIEHCLKNLGPENDSCDFCREEMQIDSRDDSIDVSKLNL